MLLQNDSYPGDTRVRHEAQALTAAGYRVTVIAPRRRGQPAAEVVEGVNVERFILTRPGEGALGYVLEYAQSTLFAFAKSLRVLVRDGFDAVHAHNPPDTFFLIGALYKLLGKRFVYDHHDLTPELYHARFPRRDKKLLHRALIELEKLSCRTADHVIATNESYKAIESARSGIPPSRITIVRNGPELEHAAGSAPDAKLREMGKTIIGYVGVMGVQDGLDYLLRALQHLKDDLGRSDFYAVLIGTGDAFKSLLDLSARLDLQDNVWFTGFVSDELLLRYLVSADICVVPDPSNPFNDRSTMTKIMEYMALGKPIVAFDLPEHQVTAQSAAIYARPNDEREFARAIAALMDDPDRRRVMGAEGRRRIKTKLGWSHSVPNLLQVYRTVLDKA
jgi:glycosyltransferase involved in cell wall biosynthesis